MSIINEYLVVFELKDQNKKKDWVNTPLEPLYCLFFFLSFLRRSSAEFFSAVLPSLPRHLIELNCLFIWLAVRHSNPVYFDPDAELDEFELLCSESSPDANPPSQLDYSSSSSSPSPSPSLDEAAAPCSGPA